MSLTNDEVDKLEQAIRGADDVRNRLSAWECTFIEDIQTRYDEEGADMWLSKKQWDAIDRIMEKF